MITGEILGTTRDERKNIIIWIAFERVTDDGKGGTVKEPITFYNGANIIEYNGRRAWPLYSTCQNFAGRTDEQALDWINKNIQYQIKNIILEMTAKEKLVSDAEALVSRLVGEVSQSDKANYQDSIANNGIPDSTIEIDEAGNVTVK